MQGILMTPDNQKAIREDRKTQTRRLAGLKELNQEPDKWHLAEFYQATGGNNKWWAWFSKDGEGGKPYTIMPRYQPGETVYIKEAHYRYGYWKESGVTKTNRARFEFKPMIPYKKVVIFLDRMPKSLLINKWTDNGVGWYLRSPLFLPAEFARDFIQITDVRPERLHNITEEDAKAEGANPFLVDKLIGGTKYKMLKTYHHEFYPLVDHADEGEIVVFECPNMGFARLHHTQWQEKQDPVFRIPVKESFNYIGAVEPDYKNGFRILWDSINKAYPWVSNPWVFPYEFKRIDKIIK